MVNNIPVASRRPRLNPFVFPSDTTLRFILLIMCVLGATLWIYNSQFLYRTSDYTTYLLSKYQCTKDSGLEKATHEIAIHDPRAYTDFEIANSAYHQCITSFDLQEITRMLVGMLLLFSVAGVIYMVLPAWKRWRKRLVPLPVERMPDIAAELTNLCHEAGLVRLPVFVWNPLSGVSEGLAFGRLGRYSVALSGGLVKQFYTDRPAFRAVIRHELAHLRNADVDKTYFSVAVWWAFVITALLPGAIYQSANIVYSVLDIANLMFYINLIGRVLALAILVLLTRNAVLRSRELYADVRASTWDGPAGALSRVLNHFTRPKRGGLWTMLLAHPDPEMRHTVVNDTRPLFQFDFWIAFGTGIAAAIAFDGVYNLSSALGDLLQFASSVVIAGLLLGGLTIGIVGSILWRTTFATLVEGKTPQQRTGWMAHGVVLGMAVGMMLSLSSSSSTWPSLDALGSFLIGWMLWGLILLGSLWLLLRWLVIVATTWLPTATNTSMLRWSSRLGFIVAGGVWATFFSVLLVLGEGLLVAPDTAIVSAFPGFLLLLFYVAQSFVVAVLIGLWAIPLAASFWRRRGARIEGANWAFLDTPSESIHISPENPFRLRFATVLGLVGGLIFCGLVLIIRIWVHVSLSQEIRDSDLFRVAFSYGHYALAALFQAGIAAIVVIRIRHLGVLHALFAAFVGGCVMTVGTLSLNLMFGGTIDLDLAWITFSSIVDDGAFLALVTALCVSFLTQWGGVTSPQRRAFPSRFAIIVGLLSGLFFCTIALVTGNYIGEVISAVQDFGNRGDVSTAQVGLLLFSPYVQTVLAALFQAVTALLW